MLQGIGDLRRFALSVEQRDTLPHGCHEGFVGPLELLCFALGFGLAPPTLGGVCEHPSKPAIRPTPAACRTVVGAGHARNHVAEGAVLALDQVVKLLLPLLTGLGDLPHTVADRTVVEQSSWSDISHDLNEAG